MQVAESRGIILAALIRNKLPITQYNPMEIKETVTGNGRADKKAVEKMIRMEFKLRDKKVLDDAIDALAVVLTHSIRSCNHKYYAQSIKKKVNYL
jgi:crossover junction endodeoxyribonuclease RuvC